MEMGSSLFYTQLIIYNPDFWINPVKIHPAEEEDKWKK
jgi:hypothetical protein